MTSTQPLIRKFLYFCLALAMGATAALSYAGESITINNPWVRATHPGQNISAGYMTITSAHDATLIMIESDVTKSVEIHSMKMENNVMKMRMLTSLALTAGKPYKLEPPSYHLMLFDLKKPLLDSQIVNFELTFKNSKNVEFKQKISAIVKDANSASQSNHSNH